MFGIPSRNLIRLLTLGCVLLALPARTAAAAPGDLFRVSISNTEAQADGSSGEGDLSGDGRYVVFSSDAANLVAGDTNDHADVFIRDRQSNSTERVSLANNESQANGGSYHPAISLNGRFVAFVSDAPNLVNGDTNNIPDIFVRDRQEGTTTRVSIDASGGQVTGDEFTDYDQIDISGDGRYVAFVSELTTFVSGDTNETIDVFVHDRQTGVTSRASVDSSEAQANDGSMEPSLSGNGRLVFVSRATNLVAGDTNDTSDIFVRDLAAGTTTRASVNSSGEQGDKSSTEPDISADGRYVAFSSYAENLAPHYEIWSAVYVHDLVTGATTRASEQIGYSMVGWSEVPVISADGRYVAFEYDDKGDGEPYRWIYVHDRVTGSTISVAGPGRSDNNSSPGHPSISGDGRFISFGTGAAVVTEDTNGASDVYVREVLYPADANPEVESISTYCTGGCNPTTDPVVTYSIDFSEVVTGVTLDDFTLSITGSLTGAAISNLRVSQGTAASYRVDVTTGTGDGTLRLDLVDNDSIRDRSNHPLGGTGAGNGSHTTGTVVSIDQVAPVVNSIQRTDPDLTAAAVVNFTVTFSDFVTGVGMPNLADFALATTGTLSGVQITAINAVDAGQVYQVSVDTGTGAGTLRLDLIDNEHILDDGGNPLGGPGPGNGSFTGGQAYTIVDNVPSVTGIQRIDPNPSAASSVRYAVTFSEPVTGVNLGDFTLVPSGAITGASITGLSGSGAAYTVTVGTGNHNGTLRLDLVDDDSIKNAANTPLGGGGTGNGSFMAGEVYTINKSLVTVELKSNGTNDGWVLESAEGSEVGGSINNNQSLNLLVGDNAENRQFRSILHFPTLDLPDNAVIINATLNLKKQGTGGTDPFTTHGRLFVDVRRPFFGSQPGMQTLDFETPADAGSIAVVNPIPAGAWYSAALDPAAYPFISLTGTTQFRLRFELDDNNDAGADSVSFFSGDDSINNNRPVLTITYYIPTNTSPAVTNIAPADIDLVADSMVDFIVTFTKPVTGVNAADFTLTTTGEIAGAGVVGVSGSGYIYTVSVDTGTGNGSLRVNLVDDDSIKDGNNSPLGGPGLLNGDFLNGAVLTISGTEDFTTSIGAGQQAHHRLTANSTAFITTPGLVDGPVKVFSPDDPSVFASQRVTSGDSYNELMGVPPGQFTTEYWFPFYDHGSPSVPGNTMRTWVLIGNPSAGQSAEVDVYIAGTLMDHFSIPPGSRVTPRWVGLTGGPVRVVSTNGVAIFASERVFTVPNNSFNEMLGLPADQFTSEYWFPWYDSVNMDASILVGNTSASQTASVQIYIGAALEGTYTIEPNGVIVQEYPDTVDGPVRVVAVNGVDIVASEAARSGSASSYNEVMGYPFDQFGAEYWFPFYDHGYPNGGSNMRTWVLVGNPDGARTAEVDIFIAGALQGHYSIPAGSRVTPRWPGVADGPVRVVSANGVPVFSSERVFTAPDNVFNEMMGYPDAQLTREYWFPWFDSINMVTDILIARP